MQTKASSAALNDLQVEPIDRSLEPQFRARIDGKAKPLGSLGRLEDLAVQLGLIWYPQAPRTARATVFVFAADHGLVAEGVSLYPASVTRAMVATYLAGRAGVNALAKASREGRRSSRRRSMPALTSWRSAKWASATRHRPRS